MASGYDIAGYLRTTCQESILKRQAAGQAFRDHPTARRIDLDMLDGKVYARVHFPDGGTKSYFVEVNQEADDAGKRDTS